MLLRLWCRPTGAALIRPLAWELPYAEIVALKKKKEKEKERKKERERKRKRKEGKKKKKEREKGRKEERKKNRYNFLGMQTDTYFGEAKNQTCVLIYTSQIHYHGGTETL